MKAKSSSTAVVIKMKNSQITNQIHALIYTAVVPVHGRLFVSQFITITKSMRCHKVQIQTILSPLMVTPCPRI